MNFDIKCLQIDVIMNVICVTLTVWANFALGSSSVRGKARPNISCEGIRTSEDVQPRNG